MDFLKKTDKLTDDEKDILIVFFCSTSFTKTSLILNYHQITCRTKFTKILERLKTIDSDIYKTFKKISQNLNRVKKHLFNKKKPLYSDDSSKHKKTKGVPMKDLLSDFQWHSGTGIQGNFEGCRIVRKLASSDDNLSKFIKASDSSNFLIHKATKALWCFSSDGSHIEPVFEEDVLTEENL